MLCEHIIAIKEINYKMISDILSEVDEKITHYRKHLPDVYEPFKAELDALQDQIEKVRILLDTPPEK
jgi:hypothetical protein